MIKNTKLGGVDWDDERLYDTDLNDTFNAVLNASIPKFYADNVGGSVKNSTVETDLVTITIPQNDLGNTGTITITSGVVGKTEYTDTTSTFKLYIGGTLKKTIVLAHGIDNQDSTGSNLVYLETGLDTTGGDTIVKITGTNSGTHINAESEVVGLLVTGYKIL